MQPLAHTLLPDLARLVVVSFLALSLAVLSGCGEASPEPKATTMASPTVPPTPTATTIPPTATAIPPTATAVPPTATPVPPTPTPRPTATTKPETGAWKTHSGSDVMTDRQRVGIALRSTTYRPASGDKQAILFIRCQHGGKEAARWEVFISWDAFLGRDDPPVAQRFGAEEAFQTRWTISTDGTATFVNTAGRRLADVAFLTKLRQDNRFAAQVVRYNDSTITATWDVTGLTAALQPLQEHCQ